MATFTADEYGSVINRCWLNGKDVTRLTVCICIPAVATIDLIPPIGELKGEGWVDLLDTSEKGYPYFIAGDDGEPVATRHYGTVKLEWKRPVGIFGQQEESED